MPALRVRSAVDAGDVGWPPLHPKGETDVIHVAALIVYGVVILAACLGLLILIEWVMMRKPSRREWRRSGLPDESYDPVIERYWPDGD